MFKLYELRQTECALSHAADCDAQTPTRKRTEYDENKHGDEYTERETFPGEKGVVIQYSDSRNKSRDVNCELLNTNDIVHDDNLQEISLDLNELQELFGTATRPRVRQTLSTLITTLGYEFVTLKCKNRGEETAMPRRKWSDIVANRCDALNREEESTVQSIL
jgi:hypothetical protein